MIEDCDVSDGHWRSASECNVHGVCRRLGDGPIRLPSLSLRGKEVQRDGCCVARGYGDCLPQVALKREDQGQGVKVIVGLVSCAVNVPRDNLNRQPERAIWHCIRLRSSGSACVTNGGVSRDWYRLAKIEVVVRD